MSTKQNPGPYDCYQKLGPDEPYFVLRAKDPNAPALVELWAAVRETQYGNYEKLDEARRCAAEMRGWQATHPQSRPSIELMKRTFNGDDEMLQRVTAEFLSAVAQYGPMASAHEAYGRINEEVYEFWLEVMKKRDSRNPQHMLKELVQIAAMAWRAANDLKLLETPSVIYPA